MGQVKNEIFQQILERNARETDPFQSIHAAASSLVSKLDELQDECEQLRRQSVLDRSGSNGQSSNDSRDPSSVALKNEVKLRDQLERLQEEMRVLGESKAEDQISLVRVAKELATVKELAAEKEMQLSNLKGGSKKVERGMSHLTDKLSDTEARMALAEQQCVGLKDSIRHLQLENQGLQNEKHDLESRFLKEKTKLSQDVIGLMDTMEQLKREVSLLQTFKQKHEERSRWYEEARIIKLDDATNNMDEEGRHDAKAVEPSTPQNTVQAHLKEASSVRFDPSGTGLVATGGSDSSLKVWDAASGSLHATFKVGGGHAVLSCDIGYGVVVGGGNDKTCRVWDLESQRMVHHLVGHTATINCVRLFGFGKAVVTGSSDRSLKVWDISRKTYRQTATVQFNSSPNCVDVGVDLLTAVSGHVDGNLHYWDTIKGIKLGGIQKLYDGNIASVQFHPRIPSHVLTNGADNCLKIVDICTSSVILELRHPQLKTSHPRSAATFSPDGDLIACGTALGRLLVWQTEQGKFRRICEGHKESICAATWGTDKSKLQTAASVDKNGMLITWK